MAEVKWIKITTDMFDNRKIKHLRRLPDGNNIVLIWVMLLTMAGRCNAGGMIFLTENIAYTPKMLADELDFEENTVILALKALEQLNMIVTDGGCFRVAGWEEYQNVEGMEKIREQTRKRVADYRERQKEKLIGTTKTACVYCGKEATTVDHITPRSKGGTDEETNVVPCCKSCNSSKKDKDLVDFLNDSFVLIHQEIDHDLVRRNPKIMKHVVFDTDIQRYCNVTITHGNALDLEEDLDIKKEDKETTTVSNDTVCRTDVQRIIDKWNTLGVGQLKHIKAGTQRHDMLKRRIKDYGLDAILEAMEQIPKSAFLTGGGDRGWVITFDWFLKPNNFPKVAEGNYSTPNRQNQKTAYTAHAAQNDLDDLF